MEGNMNIIGGIFLLLCSAVIIGITVYKNYKSTDKTMTFDEFMDTYSDNIINVLSDVVEILKLEDTKFESYDEYEYTVISMTIEKIKENAEELGIDTDVLNLFDIEALTSIIKKIINNEFRHVIVVESSKQIVYKEDNSFNEI